MGILDGLAAPVANLLGTFGRSVTLRTVTAGAYDPATGTTTDTTADVTVSALIEDYPAFLAHSADSETDGIRRGDKKVTIAANALSAAPTPSDKLQIGGTWYSVVSIDAQFGTTSALYYVLQARR